MHGEVKHRGNAKVFGFADPSDLKFPNSLLLPDMFNPYLVL